MESLKGILTFLSSHLLLLLLFIGSIRADIVSDVACKLINCGEGECVATNKTLPPFDCVCNPGWKEIEIGPFTYPACVVPNCTIDFSCGGQASSSPPPPPPISINTSDPCFLKWCGDGTCVANDGGYSCKCDQGSSNLLNKTDLACFKDCYFGADCNSLGFGPQTPDTSGSPRNGMPTATPLGQTELAISSRTQHSLTMLLLVGIFLSLV